MRKNFGAQPFLYPQLVMVVASYGKDGAPDAMNAAWGGVAGGDRIFLCLSSNHKTVENILERRAFTVSVADEAHLVEADYVGLVSGNDVPDKLKPLTFDPANGTYWSLGEKMGKAFSDGSQLK